ncbi:MAG: preprotein translocase subunit YajC [Acidobacteriota bacterium]|nr:MAG: preprotein translocase subunit YajC [Acidobacteriota bacterium]
MMSIALVAQAAAERPSFLIQLLPFLLVGLIFYFLLILPTRRRQKAHEAMIGALKSGDKVVTTGGLVGTIMKVEEKTLRVRLAPQVEVTVLRSNVAGVAGEDLS